MCSKIYKIGGGVWAEKISNDVYLLRGYEPGKKPNDPYCWVANLIVRCEESFIIGYISKSSSDIGILAHRNTVTSYAASLGAKIMHYERFTVRGMIEGRIRLKK